ncbi:MAG: PepSY domain-containing protein, partial [Pseudomonadota bacterium]
LTEIPGEVTEVEQERHRGQSIFEVEVLDANGIEMEVYISAETGEILKVDAEDADCDKDDDEDDEA